jgi:putative ABC transport system ATP-binding protein
MHYVHLNKGVEMIIKATDVVKKYKQGNSVINAVDGVDLQIKKGEFFVIIGSSGSGKSTLLQLLGGLDRPSSGEVKIDDVDITKINDMKLAKIRREKLGFIFQNYNLIPTLTAKQNVEAAIAKRGKNDEKRAVEMLDKVGLKNRVDHLPNKLSGGEQQRVAIARALINNPEIILADEPTGNLDTKTGEEIMAILKDLNKNDAITVVLVTHSEYVKKYATHLAEMKDGVLSLKPH